MTGLLTILLIGLAVLVAFATWWTAHRLRRPPRRTYSWAIAKGKPGDPSELDSPRDFESRTFRWRTGATRPVDLPLWDIVGDDPTGPIMIVTPGWGDSRLGALARLPALAKPCSRVIAWDPPGLGEAPGRCYLGVREAGALLDLLDEIDPTGDGPGVALYGWSLGAIVSIEAAALVARLSEPGGRRGSKHRDAQVGDRRRLGDQRHQIIAVIAEAPYRRPWTPAFNVLREAALPYRVNIPLAFALLGLRLGVGPTWRDFDRAEHASRLTAPLLMLHGTEDRICPIEDGRAIANSVPRHWLFAVEGAGHNDLWTEPQFARQCERAVADFLAGARLPTTTTADSKMKSTK